MAETLLTVAVVLTGLSAGLFAAFSYAVMPGLRRTDDAVFVQAMRAVNVAILNPVFGVVLVGPTAAAVAAVVAGWDSDARWWTVAGALLYALGAFVVTAAVNVPRNDALAAGTADASVLRRQFEATWVRWNHVRSVLTTAGFVCLVRAVLAQ
ncbi:DUF1772 domain-containing protein [Aeromicrobium chenweiae]|uniref:DUF1772 domain-containing protein n=1 Tax=Aeromicrobium chenweiae TaxID=2079793 RepID=A0A2S0WPH8_9ACTN|nr:anthrone oxygenase family protein [Aeromicrobium chenweiae]AWB93227.1 DUF1772 domain-containing protein [Aeromicrobium chenweiae]TGN34219.1 DUF1772 domain-containing protein [Aeromicrobium chenweiae]